MTTSKGFLIGLVTGCALMAFGIVGALSQSSATHPRALATWLVGADLVHDALVAPVVVAVGWASAVVVPARLRVPVRAGLALSALAVALGWPYVRGFGRRDTNPSALPFDYGRNVLIVVGLVWLGVAVVTISKRSITRS